MSYSQVWDLDSIFEGGSQSPELRKHLDNTKQHVNEFAEKMKSFETPSQEAAADSVADVLEEAAELQLKLGQAGGFISCLEAQDVTDTDASALRSEITALFASYQSTFNTVKQKLSKTDEAVFNQLIEHSRLAPSS